MNLTIFTDGGARGNQGPAGIGVVFLDQAQNIIGRHKKYIGEATNNVAEYKALILVLEQALVIGAEDLNINMDSELVVRQMQGKYKIKEPTLQLLAKDVIELMNKFKNVGFHHVARELNKEADKLVNIAIDEAVQ
ncbi:MAG TPA: ribonuclease HI family protein [Candidatus Limnocylindria bacterium]|nr:ribonuclease HI family protein [Candidatus Limnocylindria bacterium]